MWFSAWSSGLISATAGLMELILLDNSVYVALLGCPGEKHRSICGSGWRIWKSYEGCCEEAFMNLYDIVWYNCVANKDKSRVYQLNVGEQ